MKRIICLSMCLVMLLAALVGCNIGKDPENESSDNAQSGNSSDVNEPAETDEYGQTVEKHEVPDELDYNGAEVVIASRSDDRFRREFGLDTQSSAIDTRVYKRNEKVQQEIGVQIVIKGDFDHTNEINAPGDIFAYVDKQYKAGQDSYDILGTYAAYAAQAGIRDYLVNLYDDSMTYLNLEKRYWNQTYVEAATLHDQLYYIVGDMNLTVYDRISVNFTNLTALEANTDWTRDELYKLVNDGKWTVEKFNEIIAEAGWVDDSQDNQPSATDHFGLVWNFVVPSTDAYMSAFNFSLINVNDDGSLDFTIENNLARLENAYESLASVYRQQASFRGGADVNRIIFTDGRSVFWTSILSRSDAETKEIRSVKFDYTILPLPKLEVDDAVRYQTMPIDTYNTMVVLDNKTDEQLEIISATMELLNAYSYSDVRPYYIEKVLKGRYVNGGDSVKMLETILDGITFKKEWVYCQQTGLISSYIWRHVFNKEFGDNPTDSSVTTQWEEFGGSAESDLYDLDEFFRASKE